MRELPRCIGGCEIEMVPTRFGRLQYLLLECGMPTSCWRRCCQWSLLGNALVSRPECLREGGIHHRDVVYSSEYDRLEVH